MAKTRQVVEDILKEASVVRRNNLHGWISPANANALEQDLQALNLPKMVDTLEKRGKRVVEQEQQIRELKRKLARAEAEADLNKRIVVTRTVYQDRYLPIVIPLGEFLGN